MVEKRNSDRKVSMYKSANAPHRFGQIGFGVILVAFFTAVINTLLLEPNNAITTILQPLIFVGIGSLLYHIGQHLHALHMNVIRMSMIDRDTETKEAA